MSTELQFFLIGAGCTALLVLILVAFLAHRGGVELESYYLDE